MVLQLALVLYCSSSANKGGPLYKKRSSEHEARKTSAVQTCLMHQRVVTSHTYMYMDMVQQYHCNTMGSLAALVYCP